MTDQQPHTPTWDRVREHYYLGRQQFDDPLFPAGGVAEIVAEFDRWYQAEIAAAEQRGAERGWDEGYGACWDYHMSEGMIGTVDNPYRADRLEGENGDV